MRTFRHRMSWEEREKAKILKDMAASNREFEMRHKREQALMVEPLWYLKSIPYQQYTQTHHWKARSEAFRATKDGACELCGIKEVRDSNGSVCEWIPVFHVHHKTYERIGNESDDDLQLLCSACHNLTHYPDSHAAKYWASIKDIENPF